MRAFFAVALPADVRQSLGALQSEWSRRTGGIRWVRTDSLHVTLRFLGAIEPQAAAALAAGLGARPAGVPPFLAEVRGAGWFPEGGAPR
ncbi:MAG: RNA 2',3'-cyclic phosphodiesterase, partial [Acidobacteria bacterium]|nr:RNA 2',3'-cyclic phosphodiesterase [Acidobacteriota bacterium]